MDIMFEYEYIGCVISLVVLIERRTMTKGFLGVFGGGQTGENSFVTRVSVDILTGFRHVFT